LETFVVSICCLLNYICRRIESAEAYWLRSQQPRQILPNQPRFPSSNFEATGYRQMWKQNTGGAGSTKLQKTQLQWSQKFC
jgi:hypothetical protein